MGLTRGRVQLARRRHTGHTYSPCSGSTTAEPSKMLPLVKRWYTEEK